MLVSLASQIAPLQNRPRQYRPHIYQNRPHINQNHPHQLNVMKKLT
jgi:hypothetical protein